MLWAPAQLDAATIKIMNESGKEATQGDKTYDSVSVINPD